MMYAGVLLGALASATTSPLDVGTVLSQAITSVLVPTVLLSPWLIRYWRRKMSAEAARDEATADETDARAEVLLSGEQREIIASIRQDALQAHEDARRAHRAEQRIRAEHAQLWIRYDAVLRHLSNVEGLMRDLGVEPPARPAIIRDSHGSKDPGP